MWQRLLGKHKQQSLYICTSTCAIMLRASHRCRAIRRLRERKVHHTHMPDSSGFIFTCTTKTSLLQSSTLKKSIEVSDNCGGIGHGAVPEQLWLGVFEAQRCAGHNVPSANHQKQPKQTSQKKGMQCKGPIHVGRQLHADLSIKS